MIQTQKLLIKHIADQIAKLNGQIHFADFMQHALYAPGLGYYANEQIKFGAQGDFITAPELGTMFAKCLAKQFGEILHNLQHKNILEFGAGTGKFACDVLNALEQYNVPIENYYILDISAVLRSRQQEYITQHAPHFLQRIHWLQELPSEEFDGIIFANEVLDAMPVRRFYFADNLLQELWISFSQDHFVCKPGPASTELANKFSAQNIAELISQPYCSELNLWIEPWIKSLAACLRRGVIILCDYGFVRREYYHPQRNNGTLICHFKHNSNADPFLNLGLQDITSHVDFTAVAEAADDNRLHISGFTNLASFLFNCEIAELFHAPTISASQELNMLTSPAEMGEMFKVIALAKDYTDDLIGFNNMDKTHTL